jgi:hypothetical protein
MGNGRRDRLGSRIRYGVSVVSGDTKYDIARRVNIIRYACRL